MRYRVSNLPNTGQALNFKMKSAEGGKESTFSFCRELVSVWGNPSETDLKEVMIAYVKQHGWSKAPVALSEKNSSRSLRNFVASLSVKKK